MGSLFVFFSKVVSGFSSDSVLDRILWILDLICSWFSQVVLYMKYGFYTFATFLIFVQHNGPGDGHPLRTENPPKTPSNLPAEEVSWTWGGLWWIQGQYLNPHIKALGKETTRFNAIQKYLAEQKKQQQLHLYLSTSIFHRGAVWTLIGWCFCGTPNIIHSAGVIIPTLGCCWWDTLMDDLAGGAHKSAVLKEGFSTVIACYSRISCLITCLQLLYTYLHGSYDS